ncbi:hypothetical protein ACOMHN_026900 [Nucella lapillus]
MNPPGQPDFPIIFHKPSLPTASKALTKSTKATKEAATQLPAPPQVPARSKDHVSSSTLHTEATLALREEALLKMLKKSVEQDTTQDPPSHGKEGDALAAVATPPHIDQKSSASLRSTAGQPTLHIPAAIASDHGTLKGAEKTSRDAGHLV